MRRSFFIQLAALPWLGLFARGGAGYDLREFDPAVFLLNAEGVHMFRGRFIGAFTLVLVLTACSCDTMPNVAWDPTGLPPTQSRWRLGYVEHRGRVYPVRDLMDAAYRDQSDDWFVRGFAPNDTFATPWAGLDGPRSVEIGDP